MRNSSLSGLDLFKEPLWPVVQLEAVLVNVVHAAAAGSEKA